ncbi:hypothetical protein QR680_007777 [Steinernema hermaphroditum]|uniref:Uncharacterized protein n=1 Tax=Steinernema hermaphroditum TaxID=289476 RepID=A0AA39M5W2_9BILA|nr:hypothetical protein QR680_007777 [Steinernema hermaphroditum]
MYTQETRYDLLSPSRVVQFGAIVKIIRGLPEVLLDGNFFVADLLSKGVDTLEGSPHTARLFEALVDFSKTAIGVAPEVFAAYLNALGEAYVAGQKGAADNGPEDEMLYSQLAKKYAYVELEESLEKVEALAEEKEFLRKEAKTLREKVAFYEGHFEGLGRAFTEQDEERQTLKKKAGGGQ